MSYFWEALGETGMQHNLYPHNERHEIRQLLGHVPRRVLDIGCSAGSVGFGLKRDYGAFVWGVELNKAAAAVAATHLDRVTTVQLEAFSEEDMALLKTVDTVCLLDVLEHMYDPWGALSILAKHVPADAQFIVSLPNIANGNIMRDLAAGYWNYKSLGLLDITHIRFFTPYEMDKMMAETGYAIRSVNFMLDYSRQSITELTPDSEFPVWKEFGDVQIRVRSYEHWQHLHMIQMLFRAQITPDDQLSPEQLKKRFEPHPPTSAF